MMANKRRTTSDKPTMFQLLIEYLSDTPPLLLILHLIYISVICVMMSISYILAFHWTTVVQIYTQAHDIKGFSTNLKNSVEVDNKLNDLLKDLRLKTNSIRTYIYRYHNGLAAISSVPFFFQTNTHENISPGTPRLMPFEQRIPASFNVAINNQFVKNQCSTVVETDGDRDSQNYYYYQSRGAKSFIRCPIYMSNGDLFGFVGIDFDSVPKEVESYSKLLMDSAKSMGDIFSGKK
jgi:hypothetical protein